MLMLLKSYITKWSEKFKLKYFNFLYINGINVMEEKEFLESIVKGIAGSIFDETKGVIKGISARAQNIIGKSLKEYLKKQKDKYSCIKTILHGTTPVYLYDIYYPLKLQSDKKIYETNSVMNLFKKS